MELPNHDRAVVPDAKLTAYLLSESHPVGKSKTKFLRRRGFDDTNCALLAEGLRTIASNNSVDEVESTAHGTKYRVSGFLACPDGSTVVLRTIWIVRDHTGVPYFVTAYPD